ncbi:unnamed protein product [Agarophyton chilense]
MVGEVPLDEGMNSVDDCAEKDTAGDDLCDGLEVADGDGFKREDKLGEVDGDVIGDGVVEGDSLVPGNTEGSMLLEDIDGIILVDAVVDGTGLSGRIVDGVTVIEALSDGEAD